MDRPESSAAASRRVERSRLRRRRTGPSLARAPRVCSEHAGDNGKCGRKGKGATDVQSQAFKRHAATNKHKLAMQRQNNLLQAATRQPHIDHHHAAVDVEKERAMALLDALLFNCQSNEPMEAWVRLVKYLAKRGVHGFPKKAYGSYYSAYGFGEFTQATTTWLGTTQMDHIRARPYLGLSCDESTDRCRGKHLIVYATFVKNGVVVTEFLTLLTVDRADAASLLALLLSYLGAIGIDLNRITGINTDGAAVITGVRNGLVARLRTRIRHLVSCHCIAHREALAAKDAADSLPQFGMVDAFTRWLAEFLGRSGPWHQCFLDLQETFCQTSLELQGIFNVRRLSRD
ncbi:hypothetical protein CLOP_g24807 [Closterium sp. NIES-67]|nr:hypothetical protein CLOP_g24807 [Closterium sp. NIES-67]